ncbi:MAG: response regulator [Lachnospiraceae bacterium]|nr:response regulator [Lachnospiraceae bacterium]
MYKVVIIDDEPIIVAGLSKAINWLKWDCTVVGYAYNGAEGLKLIQKERPHIIISDIRMPEIDGLTMIAALKSEFPFMQISILTGFRDFEYAKRAITLGVSRFLLKPSKLDEVEEAIEAMVSKLNELCRTHPEILEEEHEEDKDCEDSPANSFIVNNALDYIKEHYAEKIKLVDVADKIYVSQWHLSKLINRYTGSNFSEILNGIRIEKAKNLLKDPALKIYDIAEQVGFSDITHFSRIFKKLEGISANEYRNRL